MNRLPDVRAMRNANGEVESIRGFYIQYGLGDGSPDIVGIVTVCGLAIAFGLEVKEPATKTKWSRAHLERQQAWRDSAERKGMRCRVVRSEAEAVTAVEEFRTWALDRIRGAAVG